MALATDPPYRSTPSHLVLPPRLAPLPRPIAPRLAPRLATLPRPIAPPLCLALQDRLTKAKTKANTSLSDHKRKPQRATHTSP